MQSNLHLKDQVQEPHFLNTSAVILRKLLISFSFNFFIRKVGSVTMITKAGGDQNDTQSGECSIDRGLQGHLVAAMTLDSSPGILWKCYSA